jgi:hypothetical protein
MEALEQEIFVEGVTDGYEGTKPTKDAIPYMKGYVEGTRAKLKEVQAELDLLLTDSDRYWSTRSNPDDF